VTVERHPAIIFVGPPTENHGLLASHIFLFFASRGVGHIVKLYAVHETEVTSQRLILFIKAPTCIPRLWDIQRCLRPHIGV
jgi:hypothetical protein